MIVTYLIERYPLDQGVIFYLYFLLLFPATPQLRNKIYKIS